MMIDFETLYGWVKDLPIIDWHNHLDMRMLAADKPLGSLYEVWVKSDPYKHRAMRICGEPERLITGDAPESEKWAAWVRTLPKLVGNPIFAWARMELEWLGIDPEPYLHGSGENISLADWTPSKMLAKFGVEYMSPCVGAGELGSLDVWKFGCLEGETSSPLNLQTSKPLNLQPSNPPTIQPSKPLNFETSKPLNFQPSIVPSLRMNAGDAVAEETLEKFHAAGCRVVDVSVDDAAQLSTPDSQLATVAAFAAAHDWTMLLHLGALRETSARLRAAAGAAGGFAGMRAPIDPVAVAAFLNSLECQENCFSHKEPEENSTRSTRSTRLNNPVNPVNPVQNSLPRTVLMSLNPEAHAQLAVLAGSFNGEGMPGKVQLGPAWWWCDHEEGIRDVLEKNAAYGVLSTFIGMTTDSRSLLSFVRHDYFRRILCKWVAEKVVTGAYPADEALLRPMLENICYRNAERMVN